jgi:hypothetical protein
MPFGCGRPYLQGAPLVGFLLRCGRSGHRRFIPGAVVDRYGVIWPVWAIGYVRYLMCNGRLAVSIR